jgi:hypothetical protein
LTFGIQAWTIGSTSDEPAPLREALPEPPLDPPHAVRLASREIPMSVRVMWRMDVSEPRAGVFYPKVKQ